MHGTRCAHSREEIASEKTRWRHTGKHVRRWPKRGRAYRATSEAAGRTVPLPGNAEAEIDRLKSEERDAATRFNAISEELAQLHRKKHGEWHSTWGGSLASAVLRTSGAARRKNYAELPREGENLCYTVHIRPVPSASCSDPLRPRSLGSSSQGWTRD